MRPFGRPGPHYAQRQVNPPVKPDYSVARQQTAFGYWIGGSQGALREITGTPIREFNLNPQACIECYRRGRPLLREMFGAEVGLPGVSTPAISYGHVNGLGSQLLFPEGGEVAHTHIYASLEQGLAGLAAPVDWATAGMAPYFLDFHRQLQGAFPEEKVGFSWGSEGPLTTAYELRGEGFFLDVYDNPEGAKAFLAAINRSVADCDRFVGTVNGRAFFGPSAGLCDDISSLLAPALWGEFVVPAWDEHFRLRTDGTRSAHVEDLRPEHLPYLEEVGLSSYDPSISPRLTPPLVRDHCRVPFTWRLGEIHYREMTPQDVADFVFQAAADGASSVHGVVAETMCNEAHVPKVEAFLRAGREAKELLAAGCPRAELVQHVSPAGREKLWEGWCGYLGPRSSRGGARVSAVSD